MRKTILAIVFCIGCCAHVAMAQQVKLNISWSFDPQTEIYTNNQTGILFPKSIASFTQKRATPANKDGSASFAYLGKRGIITIYLTHRLIMRFPGSDDCTEGFRKTFVDSMRKANGKTDMEALFKFSYDFEGNARTGLGMTAHFLSSPALGGPAYSEFGAVLVGDFIYYYRASFPTKAWLKDLDAFLKAIGFKKEASQHSHLPSEKK